MAATEQLNIRLAPAERRRIAAEARRSERSVSDYVRDRLLGEPLTETDRALLAGLKEMRASIRSTVRRIDASMAEIQRLKAAAAGKGERRDPARLSAAELEAVAERLAL